MGKILRSTVTFPSRDNLRVIEQLCYARCYEISRFRDGSSLTTTCTDFRYISVGIFEILDYVGEVIV